MNEPGDITDNIALTLKDACKIYLRDAIKPASLKQNTGVAAFTW